MSNELPASNDSGTGIRQLKSNFLVMAASADGIQTHTYTHSHTHTHTQVEFFLSYGGWKRSSVFGGRHATELQPDCRNRIKEGFFGLGEEAGTVRARQRRNKRKIVKKEEEEEEGNCCCVLSDRKRNVSTPPDRIHLAKQKPAIITHSWCGRVSINNARTSSPARCRRSLRAFFVFLSPESVRIARHHWLRLFIFLVLCWVDVHLSIFLFFCLFNFWAAGKPI